MLRYVFFLMLICVYLCLYSSGLTVSKPGTTGSSTSAYVTLMNPASGDKITGLTVGKPTAGSPSPPVTPVSPASEKQIWKLAVVVVGCGVTVGVILLGLLVYTGRRTEKCVSKRPKAKVDDDLTHVCMNMGRLNSGVLPAGNSQTYSAVTYVPVNGQSDMYQIYCNM
ncbi:uncharacterized protein LOC144539351 [Centroberyx gerrardi]